jgi:hypothetical protein
VLGLIDEFVAGLAEVLDELHAGFIIFYVGLAVVSAVEA